MSNIPDSIGNGAAGDVELAQLLLEGKFDGYVCVIVDDEGGIRSFYRGGYFQAAGLVEYIRNLFAKDMIDGTEKKVWRFVA